MTQAAPLLLGAAAVALALLAVGCESSQSKNKKLQAGAKNSISTKGLDVGAANKQVRVVSRSIIADENGTAAIVAVKNSSKRRLANVPIAIEVKDAKATALFANDAANIQESLTHVPLVEPRETFLWVNDQVGKLASKPKQVVVKVGSKGAKPVRKPPPKVTITRPKVAKDISGYEAAGFMLNRGRKLQRNVVVFAVARKGAKVVAAGRALVKRARPGKRIRYKVLFIGNPTGARLTLAAPPTTLR